MKRLFLLFYALFVSTQTYSQEKIPFIKGTVNLSVTEGTFECDLTLSDIPNIKDYYIRLNSGMNLLHIKSKKPKEFLLGFKKSINDSTSTGESLAYFFPDNTGKAKFLPQELQFRYVGKYPVAKDTIENYSRNDWKGNIAFNHNSLRTDGEQVSWYPILYDIEKDKIYDKVKYDIELICNDCNVLYINGNLPVKGKKAHFRSEVPQEMALFCGNYDFSNVDNTYILNSDFTKTQITEFSSLINDYKKFYQSKLNIPFEQATVFINTTPTSKNGAWLFVSYPSIFSIGWGDNGLKSLFNPKIQNWYRPFIAHELAYYYFGTYKVFNSVLGDAMTEGFAEYIAFQLTKNIIGKEVYDQKIQKIISDIEEYKATAKPFSKLNAKEDVGERDFYVYYFTPLVLSAIEKEIGEDKMWQWIQYILNSKVSYTDYEFLCNTLKSTLNNDKKFNMIKQTYLESDNALEHSIKKVK